MLGYMCLFQFWFPWVLCPAVGLLGHMSVLVPVFKGISTLFFIVAILVCIPTKSVRGFYRQHLLFVDFLIAAILMFQLLYPYMTTGKTLALAIQTLTTHFVSKVMSLLFNMLSRFVTALFPGRKHLLISWLQSPSAVILEPKKIKSVTASILCLSFCHKVMGLDAMILVSWMFHFKPAFSLSSFILIKRLFSSSSLSSVRVVSSAYLRLLTFLLAIFFFNVQVFFLLNITLIILSLSAVLACFSSTHINFKIWSWRAEKALGPVDLKEEFENSQVKIEAHF